MLQPPSITMMSEISRWVRSKVDYSREEQGKVYTFQGDVSFSDCQLPCLDMLPQITKIMYAREVLDEEIQTYQKKYLSLNRFANTIQLHAVNVPKDGNCLFHSASVAVWSVDDRANTLRDLMFISAKRDSKLGDRWRSCQMENRPFCKEYKLEIFEKLWDDFVDNISRHSAGTSIDDVPSRFSHPFYLYILANILRRPIIVVAEAMGKPVSGKDPLDADVGGVYLPLEWQPIECCKTPIVIGYSFNHFYPLISEAGPEGSSKNTGKEDFRFFPLINSDNSLLLVKCLPRKGVSAAWDSLQAYLIVKELNDQENVSVVPCVQIKLKPLTTKDNLLFQKCNGINPKFCAPDVITRQCNPSGENSYLKPTPSYFNGAGLPLESVPNHLHGFALTPTAPLPSMEPQSHIQILSMMPDRCRNGCGYRCSTKTTPLCHECYEREMHGEISLLQPMKGPAAGNCHNVYGMSQTAIQCTEEHALTPTAPPFSIDSQSPQLGMPFVMFSRIEINPDCLNTTQNSAYKCHETETEKGKPLDQNIKNGLAPQETERMFKNTTNIVADVGVSGKSPLKEGIIWREAEKHIDSSTNTPSDNKIVFQSLHGSNIQQASEPYNSMDNPRENLTETKSTSSCIWALKQTFGGEGQQENLTERQNSLKTPIFQKQDSSEEDNRDVHALHPPTIVGDKIMEKNQLKGFFFDDKVTSVDTTSSNASLDSKLAAGTTPIVRAHSSTAVRQREGHSFVYFDSFISTDDEPHDHSETTFSHNEFQSPIYSGSVMSFLPSSSLPYLSIVSQSVECPDQKSAMITNKSIYNIGPDLTSSMITNMSLYSTDPDQKSAMITNKSIYRSADATHNTPHVSNSTFYQEPTQKLTKNEAEDNWRKPKGTCQTASCSNYNRGDKTGLCETCYKVIRRQYILQWEAKQGVNVPDHGMQGLTFGC